MEWKEGTPEFGDIIRTKVSFYYHYGIFVNDDRVIQFGLPDGPSKPAETITVLSSDIYTFLNGGELEIAVPSSKERKGMRSKKETVEFAEKEIGTGGYDILHNNCEHFVNRCAFGVSRSSFLDDVRAKIRQKLDK